MGEEDQQPATAPSSREAADAPDDLIQIGYTSTQTAKLDSSDLAELLESARQKNASRGVTGVLLHRDDSFFQVLEGPRAVVQGVFQDILADRRHQRVEMLFEAPLPEREFPDWRMGFVALDGVDVSMLPGFTHFLTDDAEAQELLRKLTRSQRLMMLFRAMG